MKPRRHTPEQIIHKLREADQLALGRQPRQYWATSPCDPADGNFPGGRRSSCHQGPVADLREDVAE
jgi:hypothetical protein